MLNRKVVIRIIEVILCIACVVALRVTDDESRRVFHYLRSRSREWSLLNNVTWGAIGAALATATCGGYIIITAGLLIAAATGELTGRKTELFFLGLGVILFGIVGALSMASIENVPEDLIDNAAVFGALCLLTALVFIADLLISTPKKKDKQSAKEQLTDKTAKRPMAILSTEKESKFTKATDSRVSKKDDNGNTNDGFDKIEEQRQTSSAQVGSESPRGWKQDRSSNQRANETYRDEEHEKFHREHGQPKEYAQNFENGRALRNSQMYRDASGMQSSSNRDSYKMIDRMEMPTMVYKTQDIYQRPVDEVDTPQFPIEANGRDERMFVKMVNPGVKIMKVEHDVDEARFDGYRYSDTSQYDNVPIRMKGTSPKNQRKNRDVSFNIPPPPKGYEKELAKGKDEIEMLEECFSSLRTASTGTQTPNLRTPSTPTDPGYVRHTASNWPQETNTKTPGSSPSHTRN